MSLTTSELSDSELSTRAIITSGASKRKRRGPNRPPVITGLLLGILCIVMLSPFIWMALSVTKPTDVAFSNPPVFWDCLLYTSPSPRDQRGSRMPSSA